MEPEWQTCHHTSPYFLNPAFNLTYWPLTSLWFSLSALGKFPLPESLSSQASPRTCCSGLLTQAKPHMGVLLAFRFMCCQSPSKVELLFKLNAKVDIWFILCEYKNCQLKASLALRLGKAWPCLLAWALGNLIKPLSGFGLPSGVKNPRGHSYHPRQNGKI